MTAVAVWAAALGAGQAQPFHAEASPGIGAEVRVDGLPDPEGASVILLFPDPYSFPADRALARLGERAPGIPVLGGLSSARTLDGDAALFLAGEVLGAGAVGVVLHGVEVLPCVSQGAAPVGPLLEITDVDGHVIRELDGRSALRVLREAMESLDGREREMVAGGLLLGVDVGVSDGGCDFLVRGIIGADPQTGTVTVGAPVETGRLVRLHARDAASAGRELRESLELRRSALGADPAGALVFTCNGRGRSMFGMPDHDSGAVDEVLGGAPTAGFFAAGEIGPVGGANVLHGFTATVAVFAGDA